MLKPARIVAPSLASAQSGRSFPERLENLGRRARSVALGLVALAACQLALPAGSAQARVLWTANPTEPILEEWANVAAEPGRITTVPFAAVPDEHAYRVEIREGDDPGGYGERSELAFGNPERTGFPVFHEGEDVWIAFQFRMQAPYPLREDHNNWNLIFQLHQHGGTSSPPFEIDAERNAFVATNTPSETQSGGEIGMWPAEAEKWSKFLLHVKFSSSPQIGFIEIFGELNEDKSGIVPLLPNTKLPTVFQQNGVAVPTHARIGTYRGNWFPRPTAVTYYAGFTVATDRASAEASAFEPTKGEPAPEETLTESPSFESVEPEPSGLESSAGSPSSSATEPTTEARHRQHAGRHQQWHAAAPLGARSTGDHHDVSLRVQKPASTATTRRRHRAMGREKREVWLTGGVLRGKSLRRRASIEVYRHHRWRMLAATRLDPRGRFSLAVALPRRRAEIRAKVAGVGYSRVAKVAG
jgi:Polysaccharide lyase